YFMNTIVSNNGMVEQNLQAFGRDTIKIDHWGVVTVPVDRQKPASNYYGIHGVYSINESTAYPDEAFRLLKFINSKELAAQNMNNEQKIGDGLSVYYEYTKELLGVNTEAFHLLDYDTVPTAFDSIPYELWRAFTQMAAEEIALVIDGTQTLDQALEAMQFKGQQVVDEYKLDKEN